MLHHAASSEAAFCISPYERFVSAFRMLYHGSARQQGGSLGGTRKSERLATGGIAVPPNSGLVVEGITPPTSRAAPISRRSRERLTAVTIRAWLKRRSANDPATPKALSDGGGLALHLTAAGSPVWRIKYRFGGREKEASPGPYPKVTLQEARAALATLEGQLRSGINPAAERRKAKAAAVFAQDNAFQTVAEAWLARQRPDWSAIHYAKSKRALERDVFPTLGRLAIADITPAMVGAVIQGVVARGVVETASRVLEHIGCVFEYAQAVDLRTDNPATPVRQLLPKRKPVVNHPAVLDLEGLREILRAGDMAPLSRAVWMAHRLLAFSAMRPGNVVSASWSEFSLDDDVPVWTLPRARMKVKDRSFDHRVLLGPTIATELREWRAATGGKGYAFPSASETRAHIGVEALDRAYSRTLKLAGKHSPHGWRAAFKTLAIEVGGFSRDATELALDHVHDTAVVRAYDRGERFEERKRLAAWWDAQLGADQ